MSDVTQILFQVEQGDLSAAEQLLPSVYPEAAYVVRLRPYAGLSVDKPAETPAVPPRTVERRWKYARAWPYKVLTE